MNSEAHGFATAIFELASGYPAYFYTPGDGSYILGMDPEHGLPVRLAGDNGPDFEWLCGFNHGVIAHIRQHGPPWNSRLASLDILSDVPGWFRRHASQITRLELNGAAFSPDGCGFKLTWEDNSIAKTQTNVPSGFGLPQNLEHDFKRVWLRLESQSLFKDPGTVPLAMSAYRSGPPPSMPVPVPGQTALKPGTGIVRIRSWGTPACAECVAAPPGSHLVVFRFSQFVRPVPVPKYLTVAEEAFMVLDTQMADLLPGHVLPALRERRR